jgi:hypothetical protein
MPAGLHALDDADILGIDGVEIAHDACAQFGVLRLQRLIADEVEMENLLGDRGRQWQHAEE